HWAAAAALVLGIIGGVGAYYSQPHLYTSYGRMEFKPQVPRVGGGMERPPAMWEQYLLTKAALITHSRVLARAMGSETWKSAAAAAGLHDFTIDDFEECIDVDRVHKSNLIDVSF